MPIDAPTWHPPTGDPVVTRPYAVDEFRAMASPCRVVADDPTMVRAGVRMVHDLERRWSRFRPDSEISALNRAAGSLCIVSAPTYELIRRAELARERTCGWFNPLVLPRLIALGYGAPPSQPTPASSGAVCQEPIELLPEVRGVRLPAGTGFDPGGIGKGFAADLVVDHLRALGATAVQVELGGDVRLVGRHWTGGGWRVGIRSPFAPGATVAHVDLADGAVATSGVTRTRWRHDGADVHHLVDPFTGEPAANEVAQVTAVAAELWWAEIVAKVALLCGCAADVLREFGASGFVVRHDGAAETVTGTVAEDQGGRS